AALRQAANRLQNLAYRPVRQPFRESVHLARWYPEHLRHLANRQPCVHGDEASDHRHVLFAPSRVHIVEQLVAPRAANINIDVRAISALLGQKSLEVQTPSQRAYT